ncbi:MAG: GntR family transcriptional regulator, partial [Oscillospiraceae bacterium]|nr:GntR family transcriptional regulator [Oscillospiraceae bacterium]
MANINSAVLSERSRSILSEGIPKRGAPVYVELYRKILQLIREGEFAPGDMLPGEECLAEL